MIESFRHKGLKAFAETGDKRGILPGRTERIEEILFALEPAGSLRDVLRVKDFHSLRIRGDKRPTRYAMSVSGTWRITFTALVREPNNPNPSTQGIRRIGLPPSVDRNGSGLQRHLG